MNSKYDNMTKSSIRQILQKVKVKKTTKKVVDK